MAGGGNPADVQRAIPFNDVQRSIPTGDVQRAIPFNGAPQPNVFNQASGALTGAIGRAGQAAQFQPQSLSNQQNLAAFQNPFQQQVLDPVLGDIERQRQMGINDVGAAATRAGAFGGSRQGVAEAETNRAALEAAARASGQIRSQGFGQAMQGAQQDISNQLAGQQLGLGAAGQLGNLANLGFGFGQQVQQQQAQQGAQQQALAQSLIDTARNQFSQFTNSPLQSAQAPLQAIGSVPTGQTSTTTQQPGLMNFLSLGLGLL